ncbi:hypothetical protein [Streptomyces sp. ICBB 8177]|uniref:hypothetical protein n=1 Tax=Streptomyces sp. ICBB 8177 TaxID=563922 RepID=UPI0018EE9116|nr:hypothetical protein [Streptomyces sp. ICBB 8177]
MSTPETAKSADTRLRESAPHALLPAARSLLKERFGSENVTLLMADYGLTVLQLVTLLPHTAQAVSAHDGPAGKAFAAQTPVVEVTSDPATAIVHLPVTVRGDRLGILSAHLPKTATEPDTLIALADFATALGHELVTADRDTDVYLQARRRKRLTLAAEMRWQLLPARGCARDEYTIGAHLEPAYAIGGDNFDWSTSTDHLMITVTDGMGHGIDASLRAGSCWAGRGRSGVPARNGAGGTPAVGRIGLGSPSGDAAPDRTRAGVGRSRSGQAARHLPMPPAPRKTSALRCVAAPPIRVEARLGGVAQVLGERGPAPFCHRASRLVNTLPASGSGSFELNSAFRPRLATAHPLPNFPGVQPPAQGVHRR